MPTLRLPVVMLRIPELPRPMLSVPVAALRPMLVPMNSLRVRPSVQERRVEASHVVKLAAAAVPPPIAPGAAKVAPLKLEAFRFATFVVLATVNGAVPVASVEVIAPVAEMVVKAPVLGVPPPMAPGAANVAPLSEEALRLATLVVDATTKGAVPVANVDVSCPVRLCVMPATLSAVSVLVVAL